jgi:hypothetical protein
MGSGFKTWSTGDVLTAADVNGYLMKQTVITCTSGTRPSSPVDGMLIYETDTKYFRSYDSANTTWQIKGVNDASFPMIWRFGNASTSDSSAIGSTETTVTTVSSATYKANRAYRLEFSGGLSVSVTSQNPAIKVRKTNTSGQILSQVRVAVLGNATLHGFHHSQIFQVGGSDVTAAMVLTLTGSGSYNVTGLGATEPLALHFFEIGAASSFSWATTLT